MQKKWFTPSVLLLVVGLLAPTKFVFAQGSCACTSAETDCRSVYLDTSQQSPDACTKKCQTELGTHYASSQYGEDTAGEAIASSCETAHKNYVASVSSGSSPTPSPQSKLPTITPTLNVPIPTVNFSQPVVSANTVKSSFIADYINGLYNFLLGAGLIIVIVMVMVGGLQYTLGAASPMQVDAGKKRIRNAVTGLILLICVYLIVRTVNPQLTLLKPVEIQTIPPAPMPEVDEGDVAEDGAPSASGLPSPKRLCHSISDCQKLCDSPPADIMNAPDIPVLQNSSGFQNPGKAHGTAELQAALKKAGQIAQSMNSSYSIRILGSESGYRSIKSQLNKACNDIKNNGGNSLQNGILAWPGGSNHGSGVAVDVQLYLGEKDLMTLSSKAQSSPGFKDPAQTLSQIMDQAGFVRYGKEMWHFELKGKSGSYCRCTYPGCPFPPHC